MVVQWGWVSRVVGGYRNRDASLSHFAEVLKHRVYHLKGVVDLLSNFRSSQDNLSAYEDEKHDLRSDHAVDEAREQLRLIGAEVVMATGQAFETDGEFDIA